MADASPLLKKERPRPLYRNIGMLDLMRYRFPPMAIGSILHRMTGVALFVGMILLLPMLQMSLKSEAGFEAFRLIVWAHPIAKLVLIGLLFSMIFHTVLGVRHLIQDMNCWLDLSSAKHSALAAMLVSVVITALIVWRLW